MASTYSHLFYHIVFSTKARNDFITLEIEERVWAYTSAASPGNNEPGTLHRIFGLRLKGAIGTLMKPSTKRIILRIVHLVAVIPVLGYIYQPPAEVGEYQQFTQLAFIPVAILAGYWMYMGFVWAIIGAVSWAALNYVLGPQTGFGLALFAQIVIFVGRFFWKKTRKPSPSAVS